MVLPPMAPKKSASGAWTLGSASSSQNNRLDLAQERDANQRPGEGAGETFEFVFCHVKSHALSHNVVLRP